MNTVYLQSAGVVAPGLTDWAVCRDVLTGRSEYQSEPIPRFNPDTLPANERRRLTPTIRIAMQAATEAMQSSALASDKVATVFASNNGDLDLSDRICNALTLPERPVSPVDFHNSVHNAPAGYWAIGSHCHLPSTSLSAGEASFSAGLLEAAIQVLSENDPVLLVVYDQPPPAILACHQQASKPFAAALVITRHQSDTSMAALRATPVNQKATHCLSNGDLESIRLGSPAAQALLLLELVANELTANCVLPYLGAGGVLVEYTPC